MTLNIKFFILFFSIFTAQLYYYLNCKIKIKYRLNINFFHFDSICNSGPSTILKTLLIPMILSVFITPYPNIR